MSKRRKLAAVAVVLILGSLLAWQHRRNALVEACLEAGGLWNGSACRADPARIHIQRDLRRI